MLFLSSGRVKENREREHRVPSSGLFLLERWVMAIVMTMNLQSVPNMNPSKIKTGRKNKPIISPSVKAGRL